MNLGHFLWTPRIIVKTFHYLLCPSQTHIHTCVCLCVSYIFAMYVFFFFLRKTAFQHKIQFPNQSFPESIVCLHAYYLLWCQLFRQVSGSYYKINIEEWIMTNLWSLWRIKASFQVSRSGRQFLWILLCVIFIRRLFFKINL